MQFHTAHASYWIKTSFFLVFVVPFVTKIVFQVCWPNYSDSAWRRDSQVGPKSLLYKYTKVCFLSILVLGVSKFYCVKCSTFLFFFLYTSCRPLGPENLLLRGARLKNTKEIFGESEL